MTVRLLLLGPPRLLDSEGKTVSIPEKAYALAAFLLLGCQGGYATRAQVRQFLWENADSRTGFANLRKLLARLRIRQEGAGFELVHINRGHVEWTPTVDADVTRFQQLAAPELPCDLVELCDLYRGDLLEGLDFAESELRDWVQVQRTSLRSAWVAAVAARLEPVATAADRTAIRASARRLIEVDSFNEIAHRALMRLHAEESEPARVQDVYRSLEKRLREDLDVAPDTITTELYEALVSSFAARRPAVAVPVHAVAEPDTGRIGEDVDLAAMPPVAPSPTGVPRVAVLPPLQAGSQPYHHQLAAALVEDVTIGLCRFKGLSVVAPHTAWQLSLNGRREALKSLGIEYSVETTLQSFGNRAALSVKLINADTREILWPEQYPFDRANVAQQYKDLSTRIILALVDRIERAELSRYDAVPDPTAYHLYLNGQRSLRTLDLPHVRRARRAFKEALNERPDFVPAISGVARTCQLEWLLMARGDQELLGEAERLARRSIDIDPDDARGFRELGACNLYAGRFDESLTALEQAETRNPQFADLLLDYGDALTHACDPRSGLAKITHAIALNPICPDYYWWIAAGANYHLHQYREAIACMQRMRDQTPAYRLLAASWARLGEREQAADYVRRVLEIHPDFTVNAWLSILPVRDPLYEQDYADGLREAGFH